MSGITTKDPFLMLSVMNTKLRDECPTLSELCLTYDLTEADVIKRMESIGYTYNSGVNQFTR
ncbi:MAG: DUF4250 domain-containing protein [Cellulosilyticaceae bacterium]